MTSDPENTARGRYFIIVGARIAGVAGAILGLVLVGRGETIGQKILGTAIIASALLMMAIVPRSLARRWRTPPEG